MTFEKSANSLQLGTDGQASGSRRGWLASRIAGLSPGQLQAIGAWVGRLLYLLAHPLRRIARSNIQFLHPDWSRGQKKAFLKNVFRHYGTVVVEMVQLSCLSGAEYTRRHRRIEGAEHFSQALAAGRGVIIISGHLGNWETGFQLPALYFGAPLTGVAKAMKLRFFNQYLHNFRTRFGNRLLYKAGAFPEMRQTLRAGGVVAFLMDMPRQKEGIPVDFLGHPATATRVAALLARRCKSTVIPTFCIREADGRLTLRIEPPVALRRTRDIQADLALNTQRLTDVIANAVERNPEQWFWMQKRWKSYHPELYPDHVRAKKKRKGKIRGNTTRAT
ncbi:MAG: lysophospholipid acyltransferase family protein [Desulfobacterales bacterium]